VTAALDPRGIRAFFAASADEVDGGQRDVRDGLRWLAADGLLCPTSPRPRRIVDAVGLIRAVAAASLADAFAVWSQTMVVEYLLCCPPGPGLRDLVDRLRDARITGATGMAPAVADLAGQVPLPLSAEPDGDGWRLTGTAPWASNLFDGAVVVVPARTPDGGRVVGVLRLSAPGLAIHPSAPLLALGGTATGTVEFADTPLPSSAVLSRDLRAFMSRCQPVMLLTQAAMALGVADAAVDSAAVALDGPGVVLAAEHAALGSRRDAVAERLAGSAGGSGTRAPAALRLEALRLVADAVHLDGVLHGGRGFHAGSPTARRRREAAFLPVQAPTEIQLRTTLAATVDGGE
jgi:alkylation response protein AidB-like acyl-CoA dehydrogenase